MSKKKRDIELFIVDTFVSIQKIKGYVAPFHNPNDLLHSSLHWDATIRQLEIIGEALNKLLEDEKFKANSPEYFRKIVNFRNNIVHGYFGIDLDEVWNVITVHLDILENDMKKILKNNIDIKDAVESEIQEYTKLADETMVKYLVSLK
ncbi:HepT-like ribonuclease domain-containing protein [Sulfurimonas sp.]|uniref:HepT-like ribonuclease domain-containing protein n=1 Tax=Sulfurimonas sp. TaxID=2022749 RepID=UPI003D0D6DCC